MYRFVKNLDFFEIKDNQNKYPQVLVNPVNCVGVMGKGLALEFKNRYPDMFKDYVILCKHLDIDYDNPFVYMVPNFVNTELIINIATKYHWRNKSEIGNIQKGIWWLTEYICAQKILRSILIPALGCGNGGLCWSDVKKVMQDSLFFVKANVLTDIIILEPRED